MLVWAKFHTNHILVMREFVRITHDYVRSADVRLGLENFASRREAAYLSGIVSWLRIRALESPRSGFDLPLLLKAVLTLS